MNDLGPNVQSSESKRLRIVPCAMAALAVLSILALAGRVDAALDKNQKALKGRRAAMFTKAATRLAQSGVQCEPGMASEAVEACAGKLAGDVCVVDGDEDEHGFTGTCATTPSGTLACHPTAPPPPPPSAVAACAGLSAGQACRLTVDDHAVDGICRSFTSGVVACVPVPMPLQMAIDACNGKSAGDACSFSRDDDEGDDEQGDDQGDDEQGLLDGNDHDDVVNGACAVLPEQGGLLVCVPQHPLPPPVAACTGKTAGDACSFVHDDRTVTGNCVALPDHDLLVCQPPPPQASIDACVGKSAGDACSFTRAGEEDDEGRVVNGTCTALPNQGGLLACVPQPELPKPVVACEGKSAGDACSFVHDDRTITGNCVALPDHALLVCVPPPPQALVDACVGKNVGDACAVTLGDRMFTGACETLPGGTTLVCAPQRSPEHSPRVDVCEGMPAGSLCTVTLDDRTQRGTCRLNDEGVLACLPPAPPQDAIDACTGLAVGDTCSFSMGNQTVGGTCRALPGGATLVCAPLCPAGRRSH